MLAAVCYQQGKLPEAEPSYREAWVAYTKCNAVASADFTEVVRSLAEVLIGQQKLAEAESVLNAALAVELAQKAAETRPESRSYENPLGAEPRITALQWRDLRQFQRVIFLPESRSYQNSLGAALYRAREWPRAVMELE